MSLTEHETQHDERPERGVLIREFEVEIVRGDGRTIDARIVPYGEQIEHNDGWGGVPKGVVYREEFVRGAFDDQLRAPNRVDVLMNFEHEPGVAGLIGRGLSLREAADGLHGTFRIFDNQDGDKILELVREGVLRGVSLEAREKKSVRTPDGVIQRVKAHLRNVALTRYGAYKGAQVLAVREEAHIIDAELLPIDIDPDLLERCRAAGLKLPQRYQAHPDATDTPANETGTSETAPATPDVNAESEE